MNVLIVRLGALGDIVHAVPAAAAVRAAYPDARIDWLVDARHRELVDLITCIDRSIVLERPTLAGWADVVRAMRRVRYDWAVDFQGLLKSAVLARASGAPRVVGFSIWHLREKGAWPFYTATGGEPPAREDPPGREEPLRQDSPAPEDALRRNKQEEHVIRKNLRLLQTLGIDDERISFPLAHVESAAVEGLRARLGGRPFALINPGAAWPNKRWPPERFGQVAAFLRDVRRLPSFVLWGPGEEALAQAVVEASDGAAERAPSTSLTDLLALCRAAALMVSGDTGPLHIATAAGTPTVSIFGPTDPDRNGPWDPHDLAVSRFASCRCHYRRRCRESSWCLAGIPSSEVTAAVQQRFQP
jgi:ADP-heptose:LPS heptosyltransferase